MLIASNVTSSVLVKFTELKYIEKLTLRQSKTLVLHLDTFRLRRNTRCDKL